MNSVNLSNHSGYGRYGGTKTTAAELDEMFESMEHNELLMPTRQTCFRPGAAALSAVHKLAEKLKHSKPHFIFWIVCRKHFHPFYQFSLIQLFWEMQVIHMSLRIRL